MGRQCPGILKPMSIFLAGAGPDPAGFPEIFDRLAEEICHQAGPHRLARIAVAVHHPGGNPQALVAAYAEPLLARMRCAINAVPLPAGQPADPGVFNGVDAVVVGGGLTPAYWEGLQPGATALSSLVAAGAPYLGFSAGAMVAPQRALIGGYRIDGVDVCGEECSEGLDTVDLRGGLGLAPFMVDVHAAQAGTLSRAVGAVTAGLAEWAVAIDERTAVVLEKPGDKHYGVIGTGNCWDIRHHNGGAVVSVRSAN